MLRNISEMKGCIVRAVDGDIGHVSDIYFDDVQWAARYVIVDTGTWLQSRKVLVSPFAFRVPFWFDRTLSVSLTKEQVKDSPNVDLQLPVSRQHELEYSNYYGYPYYWGSSGIWGWGSQPNMLMSGYDGLLVNAEANLQHAQLAVADMEAEQEACADVHLRSVNVVKDYRIDATDGDVGHVTDMLVDDTNWAIRYLTVETGSWWLGHKVLIARQWIDSVSWDEGSIKIALTREAIKNAPIYDSSIPIDRAREIEIHQHYDVPGYWDAPEPQTQAEHAMS